MLLKHKITRKVIEIIDIYELTNPYEKQLVGCLLWEGDVPDPECFAKMDLCFPSGEELPRCWYDENCRNEEQLDDGINLNTSHDSKTANRADPYL